MSQHERKSRKPLLIVLIAAIVVLAVALTLVLTMCNGPQQPEEPASDDYVLFWNVDRKLYSGVSNQGTGMTTREPNKDTGYYHILFATEGRQVQRRVAERRVVNQIDSLDVMGLVFDEDNVVVDVLRIEEFTGGYAVNRFYVESFDGTTAIVNSSDTLQGMQQELKVTEKTGIFDVSGESSYVGEKSPTLYEMDCVVAIQNKAGEITHIFVVERQPQGPTQTKYCEHCKQEVAWRAWAYTDSLPLQSGHWYLCEDIQLVGQNSMPENCQVILDLNGKTVTNHEGNRMYSLHFEGTYLAMMDYSEEQTGKFVVKGELSAQGGAVWLRYGQFDLYSGTLDASQSVNHLDGTAVALDPNDTVFNMYGGTLIGGTAEAFTKADGGTTGGLGGTLKVWGGVFNFYDGKIIGGYAKASYKNNEYVQGYGGSIALLGQGEKLAVMNMYGGEVLDGKADQQGGNIWKNETSTLNIEGGVISGGATVMAARNGGNIYSAGGDIYFKDGEIKNGFTYNCGANIFLGGGGRLNMSGGKIYGGQMLDINTGNPVNTDDENLFVVNSVLNMSGGWIEGNVEVLDHMGGKSTINLSGTAQITGAAAGDPNMKLPDNHKINVTDLQEGAKIGVTAIGIFTTETDQSFAKYFSVDNSNTAIGYSDKCLSVGQVLYNCICGHAHTDADPGVGACDGKKLAWVAWPRANHLPEIEGNWYLTSDVHAERQYGIRNTKLNLSLNGYSVYKADGVLGRILRVDSGTTYNLTNWGKTTGGKFINANGFDSGDNGAAILVHNYAPAGQTVSTKPVLNIYDVTVSAVDGEKVAINTRCGAAIMLSSSTLNLYAGSQVIGGDAIIGGGAIYVNNEETVLNIDGGKIIGGTTQVSEKLDANGKPVVDDEGNKEYIIGGHGGALYIKGTVNLISGSIEGGCGNFGGNVKIDTTGILNMSGGTITGGVAKKDIRDQGGWGGNLYVVGELNVTGGTIEDGYAEVYGGNYYFGAGHSNFTGITVSGGKSDYNGGNMQIASGEVTFTDCQIVDGFALNDSPNINMNGGILTLDGCTVSGGDRNGDEDWVTGNALFIDGSVTIKDSTLEGRTSAHFGSLTLKGAVKIHDGEQGLRLNSAYREAEKFITLDETFDAENSDILLTSEVMSYSHYFVTGADENSKNAFTLQGGSSDDISYVVEDGVGYLYIGRFHCLCGHAHTQEDPGVGECDGTQQHWMPVNDLSSVKDGGYYYLLNDLGSADDTSTGIVGVNFTSGKVHLDLNGHDIYLKTPSSETATSDRLFHINGAEVVFTDSSEEPGKLIVRGAGENLGGGACMFIRQTDDAAPTKVTLYNIGLDVSASTASADGAAILFLGGELNLHNVTVTGCTTAASDVYADGGKLLLDNTTIDRQFKVGNTDVTLTGAVKIGNGVDKGLYLLDSFKSNNKSLALVNFNADESSILLLNAMGYQQPIATGADANTGFELAAGLDAEVVLAEKDLYIGKYNCVCGGEHLNGAAYGGCDGTKHLWLPVGEFPGQAGYYYLTSDIGSADDATTGRDGAGADGLYLDLNGHKIYNVADSLRMMHVSGTRKLVFTDNSATPGGFVIRGDDANLGGGALFFTYLNDDGASINLYNITIDTSAIAVAGEKDGDDGMAVLLMGGELNMYGVTVNGNTIGASDIRIAAGKSNIVDSTINGRVFIGGGEVVISGTTINGKTADKGASVYIAGGNVTIKNSTLSGGRADTGDNTARGGNLYVDGGVVNITDTTISGGYSSGNGGNVNLQNGTLTLTNCQITNGTAGESSGNINAQNGTLTLDGCSVSGGVAGNSANNVTANALFIASNVTLKDTTISGRVRLFIPNVTFKGKVVIHDGNYGLSLDNAFMGKTESFATPRSITLDASFDGVGSDILLLEDVFGYTSHLATGAVEGSEAAFTLAGDHDADVVRAEDKLFIGKYSCVCGKAHVGGAAFGDCDGTKHVWFPTSNLNDAKDGGYYYLTANLNMGHTGIDSCTINLSLNGHNITGDGVRLFRVDTGVKMTLTNWDLTEGGKIINTAGFDGPDNGTVFLLHNYQPHDVDGGYPVVNLYNITVVAADGQNSAANCVNGGAIAINQGTLNMYGCEIVGCDAQKGGAVYVHSTGALYMQDSTVTGQIYSNAGTNSVKLISTLLKGDMIAESGNVRFENVTVNGNVAVNGGNVVMHNTVINGEVAYNGGELTLSGVMKIQNGNVPGLKVNPGKLVTIANTFDGDLSVIYVDGLGKFAQGATSAKGFHSLLAMPGESVSMDSQGNLYIGELIRACMCGTTHIVGSHCDGTMYDWIAWPYKDRLPEFGTWYLTGDVTVSSQLGLNGKTLNLSLNGYSIISSAADRVLQLQNGSTANITNWGKTTGGEIYNRNTFSGDGGVILVHDVAGTAAAPVLNLYGITIDGQAAVMDGNGGAIAVGDRATVNAYGCNFTSFNAKYGGVISVMNGGTLNLADSRVTNGGSSTDYRSCNIFVKDATLNLTGSTYVEGSVLVETTSATTVFVNDTVVVDGWQGGITLDKLEQTVTAGSNFTGRVTISGYGVVVTGTADPSHFVLGHNDGQLMAGDNLLYVGRAEDGAYAWPYVNSLPTSGNWYLLKDVSCGDVTATGDLKLDLNGKTVTGNLVADNVDLKLSIGTFDGSIAASSVELEHIHVTGTVNALNVKLTGNINIHELYFVPGTSVLDHSGMNMSTSTVKLLVPETSYDNDVIFSGVSADVLGTFFSTNSNYALMLEGNKTGATGNVYLRPVTARVNCICGHAHTTEDPGLGACDGTTVTWYCWTETNKLPTADGKHYYLANDVTIGGYDYSTGSLYLDLNGRSVKTFNTALRLFHINGATVVITDTTDNPGSLIPVDGNLGGGAVMMINNGESNVSIYNVTLDVSATTHPAEGSALLFNAGTLKLFDVEVKGNGISNVIRVAGNTLVLDNTSVNGTVKLVNGDVTLSGAVQISELYFDNGFKANHKSVALVDFDAANSNIVLGNVVGYADAIASGVSGMDGIATDAGFALPVGIGADILRLNGFLYVGKYNCVCGGEHLNGAAYSGCDGTKHLWLPITDLRNEEGYFYLINDLTIGQYAWSNDMTIYLSLNGHTITKNSEPQRLFRIDAGVNLTMTNWNLTTGGQLINSAGFNSEDTGAIFLIHDVNFTNMSLPNPSVNLYNIDLVATGAANCGDGGAIRLYAGTMNLYDCNITGCDAKNGGSVFVLANGNFNMTGGSISGGRADTGNTNTRGGNLYIDGGVVNITDTTISGGYCSGNGGNVNVQAGNVTMTNCQIINGTAAADSGNLNMQGGSLTLDGCTVSGGTCGNNVTPNMLLIDGNVVLKDTTVSGGVSSVVSNITLKGKVTIHNGNSGLYIQNFWLNNNKVLTLDSSFDAANSDILLTGDIAAYTGRIAVGSVANSAGAFTAVNSAVMQVGNELQVFRAWDGLATSGTYALAGNVELTSTVVLNGDLTLHLNGYNVTTAANVANLFVVPNGTALSLIDKTAIPGSITTGDNTTSMITVAEGGTLVLDGPTLVAYTANNKTNATAGIAISVNCGNVTMLSGKIDASGNAITTSNETASGTAVYLNGNYTSGSVFNMNGGTIAGGTAASGGSLHAVLSEITMSGSAKITGGTANYRGGNVYLNGAVMTMKSGSTVTDGSSVNNHGGNFMVIYQRAKLYVEDGASITDGTAGTGASAGGGNICAASSANCYIYQGATISGGTASMNASFAEYYTFLSAVINTNVIAE